MKLKPHNKTLSKLNNVDDKIKYNAYRSISNGYIKKKSVRRKVFENSNYRCVYCDSIKDLSVDHIISVYYGFKNNISIYVINKIDNLQILCKKCNSGKTP